MKVLKDGSLTFSTGRTVYACRGLGLDKDEYGNFWLLYGHDGGLDYEGELIDSIRDEILTRAETNELADYMIALWQEFRNRK